MAIKRRYFYNRKQPNIILSDHLHATLLRNNSMPLAELTYCNNVSSTLLTLNDGQHSVLNATSGQLINYTPYGYANREQGEFPNQMFNGQIQPPLKHCYLLGNGLRIYSPILMRFCSPDTYSPFASGGINPYVYCNDDPINHIDPTGHTKVLNKDQPSASTNSLRARPGKSRRPKTRAQHTEKSNKAKFEAAERIISTDSSTGIINATTPDEASAFFQASTALNDPSIKPLASALQPTTEERTALMDWAKKHDNVSSSTMKLWLATQTLELDPVIALHTDNFNEAKKTHSLISAQLHFIRYGY